MLEMIVYIKHLSFRLCMLLDCEDLPDVKKENKKPLCACSTTVRGRVHLRQDFPGDAALVMTNLQLNDTGRYRCEVVDGLEDKSASVLLELYGEPRQCLQPHKTPFPSS